MELLEEVELMHELLYLRLDERKEYGLEVQ